MEDETWSPQKNTGNQERENTQPGIKDPCLLFQMIQIDYHNPRWNVFVFVKASCVQALEHTNSPEDKSINKNE